MNDRKEEGSLKTINIDPFILQIILLSLILFAWLLGGFDDQEFLFMLAILGPITFTYLGYFIQKEKSKNIRVGSNNIKVTVIWLHFALVAVLITIKSVGWVNFNFLFITLLSIESLTGLYIARNHHLTE